MWCLDVAATHDARRRRIFRTTKPKVEQVATDMFGEFDKFGPELCNFSHRERLFLRLWLEQMPIDELERLVADASASQKTAVTASVAIDAYLAAPRERAPNHYRILRGLFFSPCGASGSFVIPCC